MFREIIFIHNHIKCLNRQISVLKILFVASLCTLTSFNIMIFLWTCGQFKIFYWIYSMETICNTDGEILQSRALLSYATILRGSTTAYFLELQQNDPGLGLVADMSWNPPASLALPTIVSAAYVFIWSISACPRSKTRKHIKNQHTLRLDNNFIWSIVVSFCWWSLAALMDVAVFGNCLLTPVHHVF